MDSGIASSVSFNKNPIVPTDLEERDANTAHEEAGTLPVEEVEQEKWKPTKQVRLILTVQYIVAFVMAMDMTILTSTLPVRDILGGLVKRRY